MRVARVRKHRILHGIAVMHTIDQSKLGRLTPIGPAFRMQGNWYYVCQCECGEIEVVWNVYLARRARNAPKSADCLHQKKAKARTSGQIREKTRIARIWDNMHTRCYNPNIPEYAIYGARGIRVCPQWHRSAASGFATFVRDMGEMPTSRHTLDRIDPNGDYSPENCRWATMEEQCNNRRSCKHITHKGITRTYSQWDKSLGLKTATVSRWMRAGRPFSELLDKYGIKEIR